MQEASKLTLGDGRYELIELIGEGGMARVWRAYDTKLHVHCAIKVIIGEGRAAEVRGRRLLNEARAMMRTRHPGIVRVHQIVDDDGPPYIVMDVVAGGTLQQRLEASQGTSGLPARQVCTWMLEVLAALAAAHAQSVVHRDIKPSNILLDEAGHALLADFGIALLVDEDRHTRTHIAMGSMLYMAPEQRMDARAVGPAADLYAVASTAYHLLTAATPVDLCMADAASPRWEAVPQALREVLQRATRHDPAQRFVSAAEMTTALSAAADQLPEEPDAPAWMATPQRTPDPLTWVGTLDGSVARPTPVSSARGIFASALVAVTVVLVLLGGGLWWTPMAPEAAVIEAPAQVAPPPAPAPQVQAQAPAPEPVPEPKAVVALVSPKPNAAVLAPKKPPEPPQAADEADALTPYGGRWRGTLGPLLAVLSLTGPADAVRGTLETSIGGDEPDDAPSKRYTVEGRFNPETQHLVLTAGAGTAEEAELDLDYEADRSRWTGEMKRHQGTRVATVVFTRR